METFDPKNCKILKEFLTSDEIKVIDDQVCFKLENYLQDKCEELFTAKAVLETYRVNTGKKNFVFHIFHRLILIIYPFRYIITI